MTGDGGFWACSICRSINGARSDKCYSCHTPRSAGGVRPDELPTTGQAPTRAARPGVAVGTYRSTEWRALLLTLTVVVYLLSGAVTFALLFEAAELIAGRDRAAAGALIDARRLLLLATPVLGVVALATYGMWLAGAVANLPAVGAGYSRVSPRMAFLEPLVPGFNLYSVPARLAELVRKLEEHGPGLILIGLAWLAVAGPAFLAFVLLRVIRIVELSNEETRSQVIVLAIVYAFQALGLAIGLVVVWRVERLMRERAAGKAPPSGPPEPPGMRYENVRLIGTAPPPVGPAAERRKPGPPSEIGRRL